MHFNIHFFGILIDGFCFGLIKIRAERFSVPQFGVLTFALWTAIEDNSSKITRQKLSSKSIIVLTMVAGVAYNCVEIFASITSTFFFRSSL